MNEGAIMHPLKMKRGLGKRGATLIVVVIAAIVAATVSSGACLGTKTVVCEKTGLRCEPGQICDIAQDACIDVGGCGDGIVSNEKEPDGSPKEVCDDGNITSGDGCSANCKSNETCGNGVVDVVKGESCDHGDRNGTLGDSCNASCVLTECGNGKVDINEECDPGQQDAPGCNSSMGGAVACKFSHCGDGYINGAAGEKCDDGPMLSPKCNSPVICEVSMCGDSFYNPMAGEECDTGGDSQACNGSNDSDPSHPNACHIPRCGDGYLNPKYIPPNAISGQTGEQCDNGDMGADSNSDQRPDACRTNCHKAFCGDGVQDSKEGCDEGSDAAHDLDNNGKINSDTEPDACRTDCRKAFCGDGALDTIVTSDHLAEECDNGDADHDLDHDGKINSDTKPDACRTSCRKAFCGDSVTDTIAIPTHPKEDCDGGGIDIPTCNADCTTSVCGDGHINAASGEICDPGGMGRPSVGCLPTQTCANTGSNKCKVCVN